MATKKEQVDHRKMDEIVRVADWVLKDMVHSWLSLEIS